CVCVCVCVGGCVCVCVCVSVCMCVCVFVCVCVCVSVCVCVCVCTNAQGCLLCVYYFCHEDLSPLVSSVKITQQRDEQGTDGRPQASLISHTHSLTHSLSLS